MTDIDVLVLGAGAAGLMCAIEAGKRGLSVLVIDHAKRPAEKIRISGGGRCNFTNLHTTPANFLSQNPRFCVSALKRYTPLHFLKLVEAHRIPWHEKTLGQLFCDNAAMDIIHMLLREAEAAGVKLWMETSFTAVSKPDDRFSVATSRGPCAPGRWWWRQAGLRSRKWVPPASATRLQSSLALPWFRPAPRWCR